MAITNKIVYCKKKDSFTSLISTIPANLDPLVFIEDSKEIWICGKYFSIGYPNITVIEEAGQVKIGFGDSYFLLSTTGESLSVNKGEGNSVIISSNALSRINTESPLEWVDSTKKLIHKTSGAIAGIYGSTANAEDISVVTIPKITTNNTGHITDIKDIYIKIRDYVNQLQPSTDNLYRNILLSYETVNGRSDVNNVRKSNGLTYNDFLKKLSVEGGIDSFGQITVNNSDIVVNNGYIIGKVKGDVEGEATPKIHLSIKPEYGGASTTLYGHVILQDILETQPNPSSTNTNTTNTNVVAIAASPLMVWNTKQSLIEYIGTKLISVQAYDSNLDIKNISNNFTFDDDFVVDTNNNIELRWLEL